MAESLKDAYSPKLLLVMLANLSVYYLAVKTDSILVGGAGALVREWSDAIPAGVGLIITSLLNAQLDSNNKARLVFWRWQNPLPGSEAFTRYAKQDNRVDFAALEKAYGPLPTKPDEQNSLWYKMYRTLEEDASVKQAHHDFLFTRDWASLAVLLLLTLGPASFFYSPSTKTALLYLAMLIAQYLLARQAAKNYGVGFVTTVLALKGAGR